MKKENLKLLKKSILYTLLFIIVAHGYSYFNLNYSHDSLRVLHWGDYGDSVQLGRFLIPIYIIIRGKYYPPLIIGIFSLIFLSISNYLISSMLKIRKDLHLLIICGMLTTCSTITLLNATYINYTDMYCLAILLNVLSVKLLIKEKILLRLLAIIPLVTSLAIYQSYIGVAIGLYLLIAIKQIYEKEDIKKIIYNGVISIVIIVFALLTYSAINKIIINIMNLTLIDNYNGIANVGKFDGIESILFYIKETYKRFFQYFFNPSIIHQTISKYINYFIILLILIMNVLIIIKNKMKIGHILLLILIYAVLPVVLNIVCFISKGYEHGLTIFAINIVYILVIFLIDNLNLIKIDIKKRVNIYVDYLISLLLLTIILFNILYSNQCYLKKQLEFDATLTTMNRVVMKIEETDGYILGKTPVAFIGVLNNGPLSQKKEYMDYNSVGLFSNYSITYYNCYRLYFTNYLSYPINIVDLTTSKIISEKKEIKEMECFPNKNSIKIIDDVLVVKLSN